jgi:hypothetical protein
MYGLYGNIKSDIEALLPADSPAITGVGVLRERMDSVQHLGIIIRGNQPGAPAAFAKELGQHLRAYAEEHPGLIRSIKLDVGAERDFVRKYAFLYLPLPDLQALGLYLSDRLGGVPFENPADDGGEIERQFGLEELKSFWQARDPFGGRFPEDQLVSQDGLTAVVVIFLATTDTGIGTIGPLFDQVRGEVALLSPESRDLVIGFAGDVAIAVEELSALEADIGLSATLVCLGVAISVLLFFRWFLALPAIALSVAVGTAWGFGISSFFLDSLTTTTAFLGSIIIGNGINPAIMLTARFTEERRLGTSVEEAVRRAVAATWKGTLAAALAAAAGYFALSTTSFRGFSEFAIIGSIGVLCCWLAAYGMLPHILVHLDRRYEVEQLPGNSHMMLRNAIWWLPISSPNVCLFVGGIGILASLLVIVQFDRSNIEYDMSKLRNRQSLIEGEGYWSGQMNELVRRNFTAVALMGETSEQAEILGRELRERARERPLSLITSRVVTPDDVLPDDLELRHEEIRHIVALVTPDVAALLPSDLRAPLESLTETAQAPMPGPGQLPELLALGLREKDGKFGRTALLLQSLDGSTWDGGLTIEAASVLREIADIVDPAAAIAGGFFVSAQVLEALEREAAPTTLAALCAVIAIIVILFRVSIQAVLVLTSLLVGVVFLAGAVMFFDIKINFLNFMAFPVTFGIGAEYAINVLHRFRQEPSDIRTVMGNTGGAVALCSLTTILGYGSLLIATNQALFSFGLLAVIGEVTCLVSATVLLPAVFVRINKHAGKY